MITDEQIEAGRKAAEDLFWEDVPDEDLRAIYCAMSSAQPSVGVDGAIKHAELYGTKEGDPRRKYTRAQMEIAIRKALSNTLPGQGEALTDIASERQRQIDAEGWAPGHDDEHDKCELARAAACYALGTNRGWHEYRPVLAGVRGAEDWYYDKIQTWPWDAKWWKPSDHRRNLVKAGALIVAEIERLDRAALTQGDR